MTRGPARRRSVRARAAAVLAAAVLGVGAIALAGPDRPAEPASTAAAERPRLMLLTTLPLIFGEGFGLDQTGSPALHALERHYEVVPISTTATAELESGGLLLMAHPLAQPAEALVDLDAWVRGGGRLLLLADPALDWHSERRLGDSLRPPPSFADTGLLAHWGLRLDSPEQRGVTIRRLGGREVAAGSPGELFGGCEISADRFVARCRIEKGSATIVADADFLNVDELGEAAGDNLAALVAELRALRSA